MMKTIIFAVGLLALMENLALVATQLISLIQINPMLLAHPVTTTDLDLLWWYVGSLLFANALLLLVFLDYAFLRVKFLKADCLIAIMHFVLTLFWLMSSSVDLAASNYGFFATFIANQQFNLMISICSSVVALILLTRASNHQPA